MRPRRLTEAQSRRRVRALRRAGCNPQQHTLPDGTVVVTKKHGCDVRSPNPGRPPKEWFDRCTKGASNADDPAAVCGNTWYNRMDEASRRRAMREYEKNPEEYAANPIGGAGLIIGALLGAGALWWWSQRKKPAPAVLPPTTQTPLPAPPTPCEVTLEKLNTWGVQANIGVIYLPFLATPPDLPDLQATPLGPSVDQYISTGSIFVIVTSDGRFWTYPPRPGGGVYPTPEEQPELRGRYCRESAS